jgi:hypothetical protein
MVTCVESIADLFKGRGRVGQLEREFIARRNIVHKQVLANPRKYLNAFNTDELRNQILMYDGLVLEASRLDDEHRRITMSLQSDPNYQQLIVMYRGVKHIIKREIEYRKRYSEV